MAVQLRYIALTKNLTFCRIEIDKYRPKEDPMEPSISLVGGFSEELFARRFYENIRRTSSTAHGIEESKRKPGKPRLGLTGIALEQRVRINSLRVAHLIIEAAREDWNVEQMLAALLQGTHSGFPSAVWQHRKYDTQMRYGVPPQMITQLMKSFVRTLKRRLNDHDVVRRAAWVEYQIDEVIHPFGDGCGRVAKAFAGWVLARKGRPLPRYPSRKQYHRAIRDGFTTFLNAYRTWCESSPKETAAFKDLVESPAAA